jgi:SAM-dependent methyltransferase
MTPASTDAQYQAYYFQHCCGIPYERSSHWLTFFGQIATQIRQRLQPQRVLDVGCAWGFLVECLREQGVQAFGCDFSTYALAQVHPNIREFCWQYDLTQPLPADQQSTARYDLVTCIEVLEHLPPNAAATAVQYLCSQTDTVLFSSSPFDYAEATHFNVQPPHYWAEQFLSQGFVRDCDFDASFLTNWAVLFRRNTRPLPQVIGQYERKYWLLWQENTALRQTLAQTQTKLAQVWGSSSPHRFRRQPNPETVYGTS